MMATAARERLHPFTLKTAIGGASPFSASIHVLSMFQSRSEVLIRRTFSNEQTASFSTPGVSASVKNLSTDAQNPKDSLGTH